MCDEVNITDVIEVISNEKLSNDELALKLLELYGATDDEMKIISMRFRVGSGKPSPRPVAKPTCQSKEPKAEKKPKKAPRYSNADRKVFVLAKDLAEVVGSKTLFEQYCSDESAVGVLREDLVEVMEGYKPESDSEVTLSRKIAVLDLLNRMVSVFLNEDKRGQFISDSAFRESLFNEIDLIIYRINPKKAEAIPTSQVAVEAPEKLVALASVLDKELA